MQKQKTHKENKNKRKTHTYIIYKNRINKSFNALGSLYYFLF